MDDCYLQIISPIVTAMSCVFEIFCATMTGDLDDHADSDTHDDLISNPVSSGRVGIQEVIKA